MPNYSGTWSLPAQMQAIGSGNWPINGPYNWIDDVFSTYLYTGNGSTQTITNGIDLSGKGGLVWMKERSTTGSHELVDTARGAGFELQTNNTSASSAKATGLTAFTSSGFSLGTDSGYNGSGITFASWTFRKQAKFFDVVTFSTTMSSTVPITVNHNLGSVPGCIIVKQTSGVADWFVYHRSRGSTKYLTLNSTDAEQNGGTSKWYATPTSTAFTLGGDFVQNATYVAYLFAHDAGGFGPTFTDNVISCGSVTLNGSGAGSVTLGYEPQWVLLKNSQAVENWQITDNMRGMPVGSADALLLPNSSAAESSYDDIDPTATGFNIKGLNANQTYIYIAIRRPMKPPTTGTSVFSPITPRAAATASPTQLSYQTNFPVDMFLEKVLAGSDTNNISRLTNSYLFANLTDAESYSPVVRFDSNNGIWYNTTLASASRVGWMFRRAPTFFDEVCYTGDGTNNRSITHNLTVAPELAIVKQRNQSNQWLVWQKDLFISGGGLQKNLTLNSTSEQDYYPFSTNSSGDTNYPSPTATTINVGGTYTNQSSSVNYVMYLFATVAGVSKVGSYTGTGTTQQINCGFTGGARFVLIKRTDSTGDWYVWDSARGIVAGNDPYLLLNSTAAEVTNTDYVDTYAAGFEITSTAPAAINANGGSFIFLAIA